MGEHAFAPVGEEADVLGDGHAVVVQNDNELLRVEMHDIVQRLEARTGCHRPVAHHRDGPGVRLPVRRALRYAQSYRKARAGVPCRESVVWAFARLPEPGQPALQADVLELVAPPRHQLVRVALVGRVPDDAVDGAVENAVERQRNLNDPQIRRQVAAALGYHRDDGVSNLLRYLNQFSASQSLQVARRIDLIQQTTYHVRASLWSIDCDLGLTTCWTLPSKRGRAMSSGFPPRRTMKNRART